MWIVFFTIIILLIVFVMAEIALTYLFIVGIKDKDWPAMGYAFLHVLAYRVVAFTLIIFRIIRRLLNDLVDNDYSSYVSRLVVCKE